MATKNKESSSVSLDLAPFRSEIVVLLKQLQDLNQMLSAAQLEQYDEAELYVRLEYIEEINKNFGRAQEIIEENECSGSVNNDRTTFTLLYFDVKAKLTRQIAIFHKMEANQRSSTMRQFSLDESPSHIMPRRTKVPEIQLP